ncbi:MAG: tetratricopeptide repeat protein, partial [Flavisolibacter sp.]
GILALVHLESKDFERALDMANEGLSLEADNITCLNARSSALNKLKRVDEAFQTMDNALAQDPDNEFTHNVIGWNLLERGDHRQALVHFREALRIAPDNLNAKAGMKEALKSRILPYKWLLQYSFWVQNKGKRFQSILPIALYVLFRILISISNSTDSSNLTWLLVSAYILIVVTSWTIESIANFILLFHPVGKYALNTTEKWSAINVVTALIAGLTMMGLSYFTDLGAGTEYGEMLFFAGMVSLSLALPLSNTSYPIRFTKKWRPLYGLLLIALGLTSLLLFSVLPAAALGLFIIYGIGFLAYNWIGLIGR